MNDAPKTLESVHVLRHSFRPSDRFTTSLKAFIEPGPSQPRFLVQSSKRVFLDPFKLGHHMYDEMLVRMKYDFEQQATPIRVGGEVRTRELASGALRLALLADDQDMLEHLVAPIEQLPDLHPLAVTNDTYLYVDFPQSRLVGREAVGRAVADLTVGLNHSLLRNLYTVTPHKIAGHDIVV